MDIIQKELARSSMYFPLKEKYLMAKLQPFIFIGLVVWAGFMFQMIWALETVPVSVFILK